MGRSLPRRIVKYALLLVAGGAGYWCAGRVLPNGKASHSNGATTLVRGGLIDEVPPPSVAKTAAPTPTADGTNGTDAPVAVPPKAAGKYAKLEFALLTKFPYERPDFEEPDSTPEKRIAAHLPEQIRMLDKKPVVIEGFMLPLETDGDMVKTFILCGGHTVCCFGKVPKLNEWISVKMKGTKKVDNVKDVLVKVYGDFLIGEEVQNGWVTSIYRIDADKMTYQTGAGL